MKVLGWTTALFGMLVLSPLWSGYVLSVLWTWFLTPVFHIPPISVPLAIGMSLIVGMLTNKGPASGESKEKKEESASGAFLSALIYALLYPSLCLLVGAIVHGFI